MINKNVALVLSSGGARGLAHIGVIEGLLKKGFNITSISGSSIGAFVGAYHATGNLSGYKNWVINLDKMDLFKLFDFTFSTQGFVRGEKVFKVLEGMFPDQNIENFPIPYTAIATDARYKKEILFNNGSMYKALRSSMSIPTVFTPVKMKDMELIDGGVINPLPIDRVKRMPNDILVVVNANAQTGYMPEASTTQEEKSYLSLMDSFFTKWGKYLPGTSTVEKKLGFFDIMNRSIDLMQDKISELTIEKHQPHMLINISKDACSTFEFYKAKELIKMGEKAFEDNYKAYLKTTQRK